MNIISFKKHMGRKGLFILISMVLISTAVSSCKKDPGPGGVSSIYGKVYVKDYNDTFTILEDEYYGPDLWVYIIYGDDRDYGDRIRTSYDGTYEFKYLRPGTYQIYTYSKDSTLMTTADLAVITEVVVPKKKQDVEVPDLVIFK